MYCSVAALLCNGLDIVSLCSHVLDLFPVFLCKGVDVFFIVFSCAQFIPCVVT
jgi:hypothetical protein